MHPGCKTGILCMPHPSIYSRLKMHKQPDICIRHDQPAMSAGSQATLQACPVGESSSAARCSRQLGSDAANSICTQPIVRAQAPAGQQARPRSHLAGSRACQQRRRSFSPAACHGSSSRDSDSERRDASDITSRPALCQVSYCCSIDFQPDCARCSSQTWYVQQMRADIRVAGRRPSSTFLSRTPTRWSTSSTSPSRCA